MSMDADGHKNSKKGGKASIIGGIENFVGC
jgi:hypothetical protein